MEWYKPPDLKVVCGDAIFIQNFHGFANDAVGGTPANQCDGSSRFADEYGGLDCGLDTCDFPLTLFHHCAPFEWVCKFVADQHAVFIVLIRRGGVRITRHTRNGTRRNAAFSDCVTVISIGFFVHVGRNDRLATVDFWSKIELFGINGRTALREQQVAENDTGALEPVDEVVHFRNESEAIGNVSWCCDDSWKVAESGAQHLP